MYLKKTFYLKNTSKVAYVLLLYDVDDYAI